MSNHQNDYIQTYIAQARAYLAINEVGAWYRRGAYFIFEHSIVSFKINNLIFRKLMCRNKGTYEVQLYQGKPFETVEGLGDSNF